MLIAKSKSRFLTSNKWNLKKLKCFFARNSNNGYIPYLFGLATYVSTKKLGMLFLFVISTILDKGFTFCVFVAFVGVLTYLAYNPWFVVKIQNKYGQNSLRLLGFNTPGAAIGAVAYTSAPVAGVAGVSIVIGGVVGIRILDRHHDNLDWVDAKTAYFEKKSAVIAHNESHPLKAHIKMPEYPSRRPPPKTIADICSGRITLFAWGTHTHAPATSAPSGSNPKPNQGVGGDISSGFGNL